VSIPVAESALGQKFEEFRVFFRCVLVVLFAMEALFRVGELQGVDSWALAQVRMLSRLVTDQRSKNSCA
jgi:hypothetical protein